MGKEIIPDDVKKSLKETFKVLSRDVLIEVFTREGVNSPFNETAKGLVSQLAELSDKIRPRFYKTSDKAAQSRNVLRSPTVLIAPDTFSVRYTGAPVGEEGQSFILSIIMASTGKSLLSEDSRKRLGRLSEKRHIRVFVSPSCPYCPQQVLYAVSAALEKSELVSVEVIEIYENRDLAEKYSAMSVPKTFAGETLIASGLQAEDYFIESLIEGAPVHYVMPSGREQLRDYDIVIAGGGPAGLTAAIYAERSGLRSIVFEKANIGGQITITPVVENYPGFPSIAGKTLVDLMAKQAMEYCPVLQGVGIETAKKAGDVFEVVTGRGVYRAKALIVATGADNKRLDIPGEQRLAGRGVSYCATCDGYLFKDGKNVIVVGGGNSALTDALYLDSLGARVTVVHRRDTFRAEKRLQDSLLQRNITVRWNSRITEIQGEKIVEAVTVEDIRTGKRTEAKTNAVFIAIGYKPNNSLARELGLALDDLGYVTVDEKQRTSLPLIYAAGDLTGGVKQIVVAVGQGSVAALTAFEDISNPYWKQKEKVSY